MGAMLGWRRRAASLASRWKRRTSSSSETRRNLIATQRVSFLSQAFQTAPMPPLPICLTRMYWPSCREGSSMYWAASWGISSRWDFEDGGFLSVPPAVLEPEFELDEPDFGSSCLMVSPPPTDGAPVGDVEGGPLLTSRFPFSSGSSGTLMVSPGPIVSDIVEDYSPCSDGTTRARSGASCGL